MPASPKKKRRRWQQGLLFIAPLPYFIAYSPCHTSPIFYYLCSLPHLSHMLLATPLPPNCHRITIASIGGEEAATSVVIATNKTVKDLTRAEDLEMQND
jgi:hypothetical protein